MSERRGNKRRAGEQRASEQRAHRRKARRRLGRRFGWLWAAYAVSAYGSGLGFGAFSLIAIEVLHAGAGEVSAMSAAGLAAGAVIAVPLGPWMERRRKRPVMIAMDLARFAAMASIPLAYAFGALTFAQLVAVSVVVAAGKIAFRSASGAYLKSLVPREDLLIANGRMESTNWSSIVIGPPLGGVAIGLFGPAVTALADAVSYLLSALGITAIGGHEPLPEPAPARPAAESAGARSRMALMLADMGDGWRYILSHRSLRLIFFNGISVGGLIMAAEPLLSVLMLGRFGFAPWQYTLAFAAPCAGGFAGSRLASRLVERFGRRAILLVFGTLRACWAIGLAFMGPGTGGLLLVIGVQLGLVTCMGIYNPVYATYRLELIPQEQAARVLSSWSVSSSLTIATLTALWGVLATLIGPLAAIAVAGALQLGTPLLLFREARVSVESAADAMVRSG